MEGCGRDGGAEGMGEMEELAGGTRRWAGRWEVACLFMFLVEERSLGIRDEGSSTGRSWEQGG